MPEDKNDSDDQKSYNATDEKARIAETSEDDPREEGEENES